MVRLSITLMCGKSSKFWNTMPMRERSFGRLVFGSSTETPSTVISPFWKGSSAFTHLMSVDLPEPEGPQTTTTSPFSTLVVQSVSTWKVPYHLLTPLISIIAVDALRSRSLSDDGDLLAQPLHDARSAEADDEVDDGHEEVELHEAPVELRRPCSRRRGSPSGPRTYTSEVSWKRMIACVSMIGIMLRKACGSTTLPIACQ